MTFSRVPAGLPGDRRLRLAVFGVVVVAAAAAVTVLITSGAPSHITSGSPSRGEAVHAIQTPARIGSFTRAASLENSTHLAELRTEVVQMSVGQASNVKSAVYESGNPAAGNLGQIIMFIGGHLASPAPATSITDFTQKFAGATVVSAGPLGGQAACIEEGATTSNPASICVWFDNDTFGEIVSPTINATTLAAVMRTVRPDLEIVVKN